MKLLAYLLLIPIIGLSIAVYAVMFVGASCLFGLSMCFEYLISLAESVQNEGNIQDKQSKG